jgi:hypothetical protein
LSEYRYKETPVRGKVDYLLSILLTVSIFIRHPDLQCSLDTRSLFSQYALTAAGITSGTGYALYKKPKNGIGVMVVAGAAGTMGDFLYGWLHACKPQVQAWYRTPPEGGHQP